MPAPARSAPLPEKAGAAELYDEAREEGHDHERDEIPSRMKRRALVRLPTPTAVSSPTTEHPRRSTRLNPQEPLASGHGSCAGDWSSVVSKRLSFEVRCSLRLEYNSCVTAMPLDRPTALSNSPRTARWKLRKELVRHRDLRIKARP
jgi:hypothetical protein